MRRQRHRLVGVDWDMIAEGFALRKSEISSLTPRAGTAKIQLCVLRSGPLAQLAEQGTFNPKVAGSIPSRPTIFFNARHHAGVSSNGRTLVFGTSYLGSNPGTPAIFGCLSTNLTSHRRQRWDSNREIAGR